MKNMDIDELVTYIKVNAPTDDESDIYLRAGDIIQSAKKWYDMSDSQMRLHCGEMTAQEIRTVKAVLRNILEGHLHNKLG
jgi:hypothetical protein